MSRLPSPPNIPSEARFAGLLTLPDRFHHWLLDSIDLLFPPRCAGCERVDTDWCPRCRREVELLPVLPALKISPLMAVVATSQHRGSLRSAIHALKYESSRAAVRPLGERLIVGLSQQDWKIDMIVPVPLHITRLKERGYNQAELLGDYVAAHFSIPCLPAAIERSRATRSQVTLNGEQRQANMADAFRANTHLVSGQNLLLIDDVCTTGSTLAACAQAALDAGAQAVYGLTVTTPHYDSLLS